MTNISDGSAVDQPPTQTVYYGDQTLTVRESVDVEPQLDLTIHRYGGMYSAGATLNVTQITNLRDALGAWLQDHKPRIGWMHGGVTYNLDAIYWGRPNTPYYSLMYEYTGRNVDGIPQMRVHPAHPDHPEDVPLTKVLGLSNTPVWNPRCTGLHDCLCSSCHDGPLGCGD